jgi:hypothetical protein
MVSVTSHYGRILGFLDRMFHLIPLFYSAVSLASPIQSPNVKLDMVKLHGLSPRANYTDRATAACRRSNYQLVRIEGATWSA